MIPQNQHKDSAKRRFVEGRDGVSLCKKQIKFMSSCHSAESKQTPQPNMTSLSGLSVVPRGHRS